MSTSNKDNRKINVQANGIRDSEINIAGGDITNISSSISGKSENHNTLFDGEQSISQPVGKRLEDGFEYDVFISYSHSNKKWVQGWLLPHLRRAGVKVCIDQDCFEPGAPIITEIERATLVSRKTLLVLTPNYLKSEWTELETILTASQDPAARRRKLLPVMIEKCELTLRLKALSYMDFTNQQITKEQMDRLIASLLPDQHVVNSIDKDVYSLTKRFHPSDENDLGDEIHFQLTDLKSTPTNLPKRIVAQCASWRRQLSEAEYNLHLIEERLSEYVESTSTPLDLVKRKRQLEQHIVELTAMIAENCAKHAERQPDIKELNPNRNDQLTALREQLLIHQKNLAQSEIQAAKFGSLDVPLRLLNQIDDEKQKIAHLENLLK